MEWKGQNNNRGIEMNKKEKGENSTEKKLTSSEEALKEKVSNILWNQIVELLERFEDHPNIQIRLVQLLYLIYEHGYQVGYECGNEDAKENVKDWINLSDFAPDNSWRD